MAVQVSRERFLSPVYKFDKVKDNHGCAVIISISKFTTEDLKFCEREGSYSDEKMIFDILQRLKIKTEILRTKEECEKNKILEKLNNKAKEINSAPYNYNSFYCFILSYGGHGYFYDSKTTKVYLNEIMQIFNPHYCPGLMMKPKLFFLQVCDPNDEIPQAGQIDVQGPPLLPGDQGTIPIQADFIVYYSLFSTSHYSYMKQDRRKVQKLGNTEESGRIRSAFIECLHSAMIDSQKGCKFNDIVLKVNKGMDEIVCEFINRYYSLCNNDFKESFRREKTPYYSSTAIKTLTFDYL